MWAIFRHKWRVSTFVPSKRYPIDCSLVCQMSQCSGSWYHHSLPHICYFAPCQSGIVLSGSLSQSWAKSVHRAERSTEGPTAVEALPEGHRLPTMTPSVAQFFRCKCTRFIHPNWVCGFQKQLSFSVNWNNSEPFRVDSLNGLRKLYGTHHLFKATFCSLMWSICVTL